MNDGTNQIRGITAALSTIGDGWRRIATAFLMVGAFATGAAAASVCEEIVSQGIWGTTRVQHVKSFARDYLNAFCQEDISTVSQAKSWSAKLKIPLPKGLLELDAGSQQNSWSDSRHALCASTSMQESMLDSLLSEITVASPEIVSAWLECIRISSNGLQSSITGPQHTPDAPFTLDLVYRPCPGSTTTSVIVKTLATRGATCPALPKGGLKLAANTPKTLICDRHALEEVVVVATTGTVGSTTSRMAASEVLPPPGPPRTPRLCVKVTSDGMAGFGHESCVDFGGLWFTSKMLTDQGSVTLYQFRLDDPDDRFPEVVLEVSDAAGVRRIFPNEPYSSPVTVRKGVVSSVVFNMTTSKNTKFYIGTHGGSCGFGPWVNDELVPGRPVQVQFGPFDDRGSGSYCLFSLAWVPWAR